MTQLSQAWLSQSLLSWTHLQAVEAAAIIDLQECPSTCTSFTACLDPATNLQSASHLDTHRYLAQYLLS